MAKKNATRGAGTVIVVIGCLVIVALVGVIIALVMNMNRGPQEPEEETPDQRAVLVTEENVQEMVEEMMQEPEVDIPQYYSVSMNMEWHFPDGASPSSNAFVENSEENETPVYFDVIRNDTQETIYQSPVIPLGSTLRNFPLDTDLDAGTYECVCVYHLVDDNQRTLTTLNMAMTVVVEG